MARSPTPEALSVSRELEALAGERRARRPWAASSSSSRRRASRSSSSSCSALPGAAAADRRRHARLRDHRDPARPAAHRRARAHLAARALAQVGAGGPAPAALRLGPHEVHPLARALLAPAPDLPLRSPAEQHRLRPPGHRRVRRRLPRSAVHRARHAAGARRRPAVARGAARGLPPGRGWASPSASPGSSWRSCSARPRSRASAACSEHASARDQVVSEPIRVTVWGENVHEREEEHVRALYPDGMHAAIAAGLTARLGDARLGAHRDARRAGARPDRCRARARPTC